MRVFIADDHPLYLDAVRDHVKRLFPDVVTEVASNLTEALAVLRNGQPYDLLLIDYSMPGMHGEVGVQAIVAAAQNAPVMVMSGIAVAQEVSICIGAGAKGFLPKSLESKVFASALNLVLAGGSYLPAEMFGAALPSSLSRPSSPSPLSSLLSPLSSPLSPLSSPLSPLPSPSPVPDSSPADCIILTEREQAIMAMVVDGESNKEIARLLNLREVTIKAQLTRIYKRLGAKNRAHAAMLMAQGQESKRG